MTESDRALWFGERAAIRQYDGGQTRREAEDGAALECYGSKRVRPEPHVLALLHPRIVA